MNGTPRNTNYVSTEWSRTWIREVNYWRSKITCGRIELQRMLLFENESAWCKYIHNGLMGVNNWHITDSACRKARSRQLFPLNPWIHVFFSNTIRHIPTQPSSDKKMFCNGRLAPPTVKINSSSCESEDLVPAYLEAQNVCVIRMQFILEKFLSEIPA